MTCTCLVRRPALISRTTPRFSVLGAVRVVLDLTQPELGKRAAIVPCVLRWRRAPDRVPRQCIGCRAVRCRIGSASSGSAAPMRGRVARLRE